MKTLIVSSQMRVRIIFLPGENITCRDNRWSMSLMNRVLLDLPPL
jgi:hypothetical protein